MRDFPFQCSTEVALVSRPAINFLPENVGRVEDVPQQPTASLDSRPKTLQ